jgi:putative transposase
VYNHFLALSQKAVQTGGTRFRYYAMSAQLPALKGQHPWLKEIDATALQTALHDLEMAYQHHEKQHQGAPKFKAKHKTKPSYTSKNTRHTIRLEGSWLRLPKIGWARLRLSRQPEGRILSATVRLAPSGKWYVSLLCEVNIEPFPKVNKHEALDLGLKEYATLTDGTKFPGPKPYYQEAQHLARLQRKLARQQRGGKNYTKTKRKLARLHERIANRRRDFLHQLSTR